MKNKRNSKLLLTIYLKWPLIFAGLTVILDFIVITAAQKAVPVLLVFNAVFIVAAIILYFYSKKTIYSDLISFANGYDDSGKRLINDMPFSAVICDRDGSILWKNKKFKEMLKLEKSSASNIQAVFPDITKEILQKLDEVGLIHSSFGERRYIIEMKPDSVDIDEKQFSKSVIALYIQDETELLNYQNAYMDSRLCEGIIFIDNFDETMASVEEVRQSLLIALVDRRISNYIESMNGIVKKLEKDKYFFCVMDRDMNRMIDDRFSLLEEVKTINIGNESALTLSIGVGRDGKTYAESYAFATGAMELALGRGGDQAIVKSGEDVSFFGGKSSAKEKNTRVKARVKAQAFRDLLDSGDRLIVMGHKNGDPDSFGACIGIWKIAYSLGKKAYIVMESPADSFRQLYEQFSVENGYPDDMFISGEDAKIYADRNTIITVVDTNKAGYTDEPRLLVNSGKIVVVDHHRKSAESIENTALSYVEPYASSASELVTELVQYIGDGIKLKPAEAEALYAGIVIDTQNFTVQTGVRTFEAAAFLKRNGADLMKIKMMFREKLDDYRAKADSINRASIYKDGFAMSTLNPEGLSSPTVVCAQTANNLLQVNGIKAAFVLTEYDGQVYVSARSIDDVNVQLIMEKLGGGGHKTIAGTQFTGIGIEEGLEKVKATIDAMMAEGELE